MIDQPITATVSGSFRQAMGAVQDAVYRLTDAGVRVLSPADPRVVDRFGDFLFVASDMVRAIKLVQSRHLAAINASDFLWLVAPQGYVGRSGSMEIGFAVATGTPIFSSEVPTDLTLRQYVAPLASPEDAIRVVREQRAGTGDPAAADVPSSPWPRSTLRTRSSNASDESSLGQMFVQAPPPPPPRGVSMRVSLRR